MRTPVLFATQSALDLEAPFANLTFAGTVSGITTAMVNLGNADNVPDLAKPISTAAQSALDLEASSASVTMSLALKADQLTTCNKGDDGSNTAALLRGTPDAFDAFGATRQAALPHPKRNEHPRVVAKF